MWLVEADEITKSDWKLQGLYGIEWIISENVFQTCDDQREAERIEPRFEKTQSIRQPCKFPTLFARDLLELGYYDRSYGHFMLQRKFNNEARLLDYRFRIELVTTFRHNLCLSIHRSHRPPNLPVSGARIVE